MCASFVCPLVQYLVEDLLDEWGVEGYLREVRKLADFYKEVRR